MKKNNIIIILLTIMVILFGAGLILTSQQPAKVIVVNKTVNNTTNNTTIVNPTVEKISTDEKTSNDNNKYIQTVSNDNPNNLPKSKSEIQTEYEAKGLGYEGSIAQSQGISESEYWNDIYGHQ